MRDETRRKITALVRQYGDDSQVVPRLVEMMAADPELALDVLADVVFDALPVGQDAAAA